MGSAGQVIGRLASRLRLWRDCRGTGAIEFALVAPMLALFALGISDLSLGLARKYKLEQASYRALELVTVGTIVSDYSYVRAEAASAAGVAPDKVTVLAWLECDGTQQEFSTTCTPAQQTARFLTVTITDDYQTIFPYGPVAESLAAAREGKIPLTARSTIRIQ